MSTCTPAPSTHTHAQTHTIYKHTAAISSPVSPHVGGMEEQLFVVNVVGKVAVLHCSVDGVQGLNLHLSRGPEVVEYARVYSAEETIPLISHTQKF